MLKAMTTGSRNDHLMNLESHEGRYIFMDIEPTPEPSEGVLPTSSAPTDEEYSAGSSDGGEGRN